MPNAPNEAVSKPVLAAPGEPTGDSDRAAQSFWQLMFGTSVLACTTHIAFLALFYWTGVTALAVVNVGSVALYIVVCTLMYKRVALSVALPLLLIEVLAHAGLASYWIGWESGFYVYAILTIPVLVVADLERVQTKILAVTGNILLMLGMDVLLRNREPYYALPTYLIEGLHYFNLLVCLLILTFLVSTYFRLVTRAESQLRLMATTDPLTHLLNRRSMMGTVKLERMLQRSAGRGLSLILCDIDYFKQINDDHGHEAGDRVLQAVSETLVNGVRASDRVARWGGEEFLILLVGTRAEQARAIAEKLCARVAERSVEFESSAPVSELKVTVTMGVSEMQPESTESLEDAIARADAALYKGKRAGRNCVKSHHVPQAIPA